MPIFFIKRAGPSGLLLAGSVWLLTAAAGPAANVPPVVALTSPIHGAFAAAPANVQFVAKASDANGTVVKVDFFSGTNKLATVTNVPYVFQWSNVVAGPYNLTAVATDNGGRASTSAVASVSVLAGGTALKVMPLGDSLTEGDAFSGAYPGAYRVRLWTALVAAGLNVDFVGSASNGPAELGDHDHEGHAGYFIGPALPAGNNALYPNLDAWLGNAQPHVILLMIGANDILQNYDFANAPARLAGLIDKIQSNAPNAHLIVSSLTPFQDLGMFNRARFLNDQIPSLVSARRAAGRRISFVDGAKSLTRFELADGIHPTTNAYSKLADFWFGALWPVLSCQAPPEVVLTSPTNGFKFTAPSNLTLTATATDAGGTIRRVEFYQDDAKIGEATNAPFSVTVSNLASGRFRFSARAINASGASCTTAENTVQDQWQFIRGINVGGAAVAIEGNEWLSQADAESLGFNIPSNAVYVLRPNYSFPLVPAANDPNLQAMIQGVAFAPDASQPLTLRQSVNNGSYRVYLWEFEDFADYARMLNIRVQGVSVATNVCNWPLGTWQKLGPYPASVTNGLLTVDILRNLSGGPSIFGVAIFKADSTNTPPALSTPATQVTLRNTPAGPVPLNVIDDFTPPGNLLVSASCSNTTLMPTNRIVLSGSGVNRTIMLAPASNQIGTALITITARDKSGLTNATSFLLIVADPPVASNLTSSVTGDTNSALVLTASTPNGGPLVYAPDTAPTNGLLSGFNATSGAFTYTPAHAFVGKDSFTFSVSDGLFSATGAVNLTVVAPTDANTNGIPDPWETAHFQGLIPGSAASADPDGDGLSNLQEYLADTGPIDARSSLQIVSARRDGATGAFVVTWQAVGGVRYRIRFSNGAVNGRYNGSWLSVRRGIAEEMCLLPPGTPCLMTFIDDGSLTGPPSVPGVRYFRIQAVRE